MSCSKPFVELNDFQQVQVGIMAAQLLGQQVINEGSTLSYNRKHICSHFKRLFPILAIVGGFQERMEQDIKDIPHQAGALTQPAAK
jgi:hypothetical protein